MINWRSHSWYQWLIFALFLLVAGFTLSKSVHTVREVIYWQAHQDESIRGWMSVGYVAHSYRVPAEVLSLSLGLSLKQPDKRPLRKIATIQHRSMKEIKEILQNAIIQTRPTVYTTTETAISKTRTSGVAMNFTDQLLVMLLLYGLIAIFSVTMVAAVGAPLPTNLMLIAAGSFVKQGEMTLWQVIIVASIAAVLGDLIGYGLSRWGGRRLLARISNKLGGAEKIKKTEALAKRWGGTGIFFSRWLLTSLGPWINVTSGIADYPWRRFILWVVLGDVLWVFLYVMVGYIFSDRVQAIAELLSYFTWVFFGFIVTVILGWKIMQYLRSQSSVNA